MNLQPKKFSNEVCSAYSNHNIRCKNYSIDGSMHCNLHREKAINLYIKYKKLCDACENLNIKDPDDKNHIDHIIHCYILYNKAFDARVKHRKYSFVPEFYDEGHNYQFEKLKDKISDCENLLSKLYEEELDNFSDVITQNSEVSKKSNKHVMHPNNKKKNHQMILLFRKYRNKIEKEENDFINKCITENKLYLESKNTAIDFIQKQIFKLFLSEKHNNSIFIVTGEETNNMCEAITFGFCDQNYINYIAISIFQFILILYDYNNDPLNDNFPHKVSLRHNFDQNLNLIDYYGKHSDDILIKFSILLLSNPKIILFLISDIVCDVVEMFLKENIKKFHDLLYYLIKIGNKTYLLRGISDLYINRNK